MRTLEIQELLKTSYHAAKRSRGHRDCWVALISVMLDELAYANNEPTRIMWPENGNWDKDWNRRPKYVRARPVNWRRGGFSPEWLAGAKRGAPSRGRTLTDTRQFDFNQWLDSDEDDSDEAPRELEDAP